MNTGKLHNHDVFAIKAGDRLPVLEIHLLDCKGVALDLTTYQSVLLTIAACVGGRRIVNRAPMTKLSPATAGKVTYAWLEGDTAVPGDYNIEVTLTPDALAYASFILHGTAPNDGVTYTAKQAGVSGNSIRVEHANQPANSPLSVTVSGNDITVKPAVNNGVLASLNVNGAAPNDGVVYTAKAAGTAGNAVRVAHVVAGASTPLSVAVTGNDITVNVATTAASAAASTASQVKAAVDAHAGATALVSTAVEGTGADVVVAQAMTSLTNGAGPTITSTANQVKAAVDASAVASALVTTAVEGTGADVVVATGLTNLVGGVNQKFMSLPSGGYGKLVITSAL